MHSIAAPILNKIAATQTLQTAFAKRVFPLDVEAKEAALEAEEAKLHKAGVPLAMGAVLLTVGPLLWENRALMKFVAQNPKFQETIPDVATSQEAVMLATREFRLTTFQQQQLAKLLAHPLN